MRLLDAGAALDAPAAAAARRRPGPGGGARGGARPGRDRRPDLRADRGLLAGLHARVPPRRPSAPARPAGRCREPRSASSPREILVRGPTVAPAALAEDGWLHTGDLGRLDDEGYLWVEGRRDDLIVSGGENVRPDRVEAALLAHPGVAEVAVAGREDREWGQAVIAFVVAPATSRPRS